MVFCNIGLDYHSFTFDQRKLKFKKKRKEKEVIHFVMYVKGLSLIIILYICAGVIWDFAAWSAEKGKYIWTR